jgi:hypothetical protein
MAGGKDETYDYLFKGMLIEGEGTVWQSKAASFALEFCFPKMSIVGNFNYGSHPLSPFFSYFSGPDRRFRGRKIQPSIAFHPQRV